MQMLAVNFHYIRNEKPKEGIYPRSVNEFKYQIAELAHHYEFLSLSELQKMISDGGKSKGNYCVITFDDNLKEQMCIFDYLENNSIPAIFFSTTLPYLNKSVHDVHKTHHIYTQHTDEKLASYLDEKHGFYNVSFTEEQMNNAYSYDNEIKKKIKLLDDYILKIVPFVKKKEKGSAENPIKSRSDPSGKSLMFGTDYYFNESAENGSMIRTNCTDWSAEIENNRNWQDNLGKSINSKEFNLFIIKLYGSEVF